MEGVGDKGAWGQGDNQESGSLLDRILTGMTAIDSCLEAWPADLHVDPPTVRGYRNLVDLARAHG